MRHTETQLITPIRIVLTAVLLLLSSVELRAQHSSVTTIGGDNIVYSYHPADSAPSSTIDDYLSADLNDRNVRFNVIGGPGYSANTGWRLSAIGNLYYRQRGTRNTAPGTLTLSATASLTGYYSVSFLGRNSFRDGKHRLEYGAELRSEPTYIWGLDYATSARDLPGEYTAREYGAWIDYRYALTERLFLSLAADFLRVATIDLDSRTQQIIDTKATTLSTTGLGIGLGYDSRRATAHSTRGIYARAEFIWRPRFAGSYDRDLYELNITFDYFQPLWRGGTLALDIYGEFHNAATPWLLRAELGGDNRMRGYFPGRYNGDGLVAAQVELRQHLWDGLGVVAWGGVGTTFSATDRPSWDRLLPSYGIGLRWALNALTSIRLDMAFGRNSRYLILGLNEAF